MVAERQLSCRFYPTTCSMFLKAEDVSSKWENITPDEKFLLTPKTTTAAILQCPQPHTLPLGPVSGPFPATHQENNPESQLSKSNPLLQPLAVHAVPLPHATHLSSPGPFCRQGSSLIQQKVNKAQNSISCYARLLFCWVSGLNQYTKESGDSQSQGKERSVQKDTASSRDSPKYGFGKF